MIVDPHSDNRLAEVHPDLAKRWQKVRSDLFDRYNLQIRVTQGFRSYTQQWELYAIGRRKNQSGQWIVFDKKKIVTYARGGESFHNFGLALDSAFMGPDPYLHDMETQKSDSIWKEYGRLCEKYGLIWGGNWKIPDRPHCEKNYGLTLETLQTLFEENGISAIFGRINKILWLEERIVHEHN